MTAQVATLTDHLRQQSERLIAQERQIARLTGADETQRTQSVSSRLGPRVPYPVGVTQTETVGSGASVSSTKRSFSQRELFKQRKAKRARTMGTPPSQERSVPLPRTSLGEPQLAPSVFTRLGETIEASTSWRGSGGRTTAAPVAKDALEESPFTTRVRDHPLPKNFVAPDMGKYNGDGCPKEHLNHFKALMQLQRAPDEIMCRALPVTLTGTASTWYNKLERGSISTFAELRAQFENSFAGGMRPKKTIAHMFTIRQGDRESVRDYVRRFHAELVQVDDADGPVVIAAFCEGLQDSGLVRKLAEDPAKTLVELWGRANRYASGEKAVNVRDMRHNRDRFFQEESKGPWRSKRDLTFGKRLERPLPPRVEERTHIPLPPPDAQRDRTPGKYGRYTPLKVGVEKLAAVLAVRPDFVPPPSIGQGDARFFCAYHNERGHLTHFCRHLIDDVERKVRMGELSDFVAAPLWEKKQRNAQARPREDYETIHAISGGVTIHGETSRERATYEKAARPRPTPAAVHEVCGVTPSKRPRSAEITFSDSDLADVRLPHEDPLVISVLIDDRKNLARVLVDSGSSTDILWYGALIKLGISLERMTDHPDPLVGFAGDRMFPVGVVELSLVFGAWPKSVRVQSKCIVVDTPSEWNMILGRSTMSKIGAVVSTYHQVMKFMTPNGVGCERGNQDWARVAYSKTVKGTHHNLNSIEKADVAQEEALALLEERERVEPAEAISEFPLEEGRPERKVRISDSHGEIFQKEILEVLREFKDVFAFSHEEMPGIRREVIQHCMNADPNCRPVRQKTRPMTSEKSAAVALEVEKLLAAGFIREVQYSRWVSNVVMVKKTTGQWRMCVDFKDVNNVCPKDSFPLPKIDRLVDSTAGHAALSFMDAYSGYNQVKLNESDEALTTFVTDRGLYCYKVMPFGVKNGCATFQRLVNGVFKDELGVTVEVYIDLVGPFPTATGGFRFLVVAVDYFSKWVEAKALVGITAADMTKFVWKNIVCRFGVPRSMVADNGPQFNCPEFINYMNRLGTRVHFASVAYPQSNGQVEAVNKTIVRCLEKRLKETTKGKKNWPEELPAVLWAQRTKPNESTGDTPFALTYGSEAVLPVEIGCLTARIMRYDASLNDERRRLDLDLADERREMASLRNAAYKQKVARHYNSKVKPRVFQVGELVLKRTIQGMKLKGQGKLGAPWMGPYAIARIGKNGAYDLTDPQGRRLNKPWNASQLKKYYA